MKTLNNANKKFNFSITTNKYIWKENKYIKLNSMFNSLTNNYKLYFTSNKNSSKFQINSFNLNKTKNNFHLFHPQKKTFTVNLDYIISNIRNSHTFEDFMTIFESIVGTISNESIPNQIKYWLQAIETANTFLCNKVLFKEDIFKFLGCLNNFQPKTIKKTYVQDKIIRNPHYSESFSNNHLKQYYKMKRPRDFIFQSALNIKEAFTRIKKAYLENNLVVDEEEDTTLHKSINDLMEIYVVFFNNIEKKIIDDIYYGRTEISIEDCCFLIQAFGIATEGSNLFYEVLMRKISKNFNNFLNLAEVNLKVEIIQILVNYIPHEIFSLHKSGVLDESLKETFIEEGLTEQILLFYDILFGFIIDNCNNQQIFNNSVYLNLIQGLLRIDMISKNIVKQIFTGFIDRVLQNKEKEGEKEKDIEENKNEISKEMFFNYIEIITYFTRLEANYDEFSDLIKSQINILEHFFIDKYVSNFNMKEIATIFWFYHNFNLIDEKLINKFDERIHSLLNLALIEIENLDRIHQKEMNWKNRDKLSNKIFYGENKDHKIDNYDLEAILFFASKFSYNPTMKFMNKILVTLKTYHN